MANTTQADYSTLEDRTVVFFFVVGLIVFLSGILGNLFLMVTLATQRPLKTVHNVFIANLALADFLVVASGLPFLLLDLMSGTNPLQEKNGVCGAVGFLLCTSYSASLLSLLSISLNRYVKVCHAGLFHRLFTVRKTIAGCIALWLFALLVNTCMAVLTTPHGYYHTSHLCTALGRQRKSSSIFLAVHLILPVILIAFFNYSIFRKWQNSRQTLRKGPISRRRQPNTKLRLACDFNRNARTLSKNIIINIAINTNSITDIETETATNIPRPSTPWPVRKVHAPPSSTKSKCRKLKAAKSKYPDLFGADCGQTAGIRTSDVCVLQHLPDPESHIVVEPDEDFRTDMDSGPRETFTTHDVDSPPRRRARAGPKTSHEVALLRSLMAISICVTLFCTPMAVCVLVDLVTDVASEVMVTACLLLFVNCALNWVIYGVMNTSFRRAYVRALRLCIRRKNRSYPVL